MLPSNSKRGYLPYLMGVMYNSTLHILSFLDLHGKIYRTYYRWPAYYTTWSSWIVHCTLLSISKAKVLLVTLTCHSILSLHLELVLPPIYFTTLQQTWVFSTYFYLWLLKNVNKPLSFYGCTQLLIKIRKLTYLFPHWHNCWNKCQKKKLNKSVIHGLDECRR